MEHFSNSFDNNPPGYAACPRINGKTPENTTLKSQAVLIKKRGKSKINLCRQDLYGLERDFLKGMDPSELVP